MNTQDSITREAPPGQLLSAAFNQDYECFSIGYEAGFRVYNSDPMELRVKQEFKDGGIGIVQMLHRTNYLALVGGGRNPKFPQNKVIIWDDRKGKPALSLEFLSPLLNVLLSRSRIIVVLKSKVHVYAFSSPPTRIASYDTADNPHGVAALSNHILAFPSRTDGQVQIVNLAGSAADGIEQRNLVSIVRAHRAPIRALALNESGTIVASASEMGTIIRLHSTANTALLHEFRRGLDRAIVFSMAFSPSSTKLAIISDKNTLHVFDTKPISSPFSPTSNRRHVLGKLPLMPKYFSSEWSFVSARVSGHRGVLGWTSEDSIIIIWITECRWEKYVIVKKEASLSSDGGAENQWELVREAWRGFKGLTYD